MGIKYVRMSLAIFRTRTIPVILCAAYAVWLVVLALQAPPKLDLGQHYESTAAVLETLHTAIESYHASHGEYLATGGGWRLIGDGSSAMSGSPDLQELLRVSPAFTDPAKTPAVSIIYSSDGHDYKLLAHLSDRRMCLKARQEAPQTIDPARFVYIRGFLHDSSWPVSSAAENAAAVAFLKAHGKYPPLVDPALHQYIRGTCWAFGYWSPGAASW
jgi:hypothetical protein